MARLAICWAVEVFFVIAASIPTLRPIMSAAHNSAGDCGLSRQNISRRLSRFQHGHGRDGEAHHLEDDIKGRG
ncbi:hypothetical protein BJY01DRAFT_212070 [Aspergillus pseudoustus]|uniref:Secreted protein n=1 Tax=Aspergillus pseudoustus TaxID=1810923 RepID=A0ABR4K9Z1_9EURO